MKNDLYSSLDLDKTATPKEIKDSYREKAKKHHPDKPNGDSDKFAEISQAYAVLINPVKRDHYNQTNEIKETDEYTECRSIIMNVFNQVIGNGNFSVRVPIISVMDDLLNTAISKLKVIKVSTLVILKRRTT